MYGCVERKVKQQLARQATAMAKKLRQMRDSRQAAVDGAAGGEGVDDVEGGGAPTETWRPAAATELLDMLPRAVADESECFTLANCTYAVRTQRSVRHVSSPGVLILAPWHVCWTIP